MAESGSQLWPMPKQVIPNFIGAPTPIVELTAAMQSVGWRSRRRTRALRLRGIPCAKHELSLFGIFPYPQGALPGFGK